MKKNEAAPTIDLNVKADKFMRDYDKDRIINTQFKEPSDYRLEGNQLYIATILCNGTLFLDIKTID